MDLYLVDWNWNKQDVIDSFNSVIWTERYNASGDCTLVVEDNGANRTRFQPGFLLATPDSDQIMVMETVNIKDGAMKCQGNTLVDSFKTRFFRNRWQTDKTAWAFTATNPATIVDTIIQRLVAPATYLTDGTVLPSAKGATNAIVGLSRDAIPSATAISISVNYGTVYDAIKAVADAAAMGFKVYVAALDGSGATRFKSYFGLDRRSTQSTNSPVILAPTMDNLTGVEELHSTKLFRNSAYVWPAGITAQSQIVWVTSPGTSTTSSWARRSMMVDASDVNAADYSASDLTDILTRRGLDALANNNFVRTVDGQMVLSSEYQYGIHYNLGDIVELRGTSVNVLSAARVVEYIRAQDSTGQQAYPTLSVID